MKTNTMKTTNLNGAAIKADNGSGYKLSSAFPRRRFHDNTVYRITFNGVRLEKSTVVSIARATGKDL